MKVIRKVLSSLTVTLDGCTYGWIDGQTIIIKRCFVRVKVHEDVGGEGWQRKMGAACCLPHLAV